MDSKRFLLCLSVLTAAFCAVIAAVNFSQMPPFGNAAATVVSGSSASVGTSSAGALAASSAENRDEAFSGTSAASSESASSKTGSASVPASPVNINTASKEELAALPGIGDTKAQAILDYRTANGPFQTIEDLEKVKGIKDATFGKIKAYVTVS